MLRISDKLYANVSPGSRAFLGIRAPWTRFTPSKAPSFFAWVKTAPSTLLMCCSVVLVRSFSSAIAFSMRLASTELPHANRSDTLRNVVDPDFPIPFLCRSTQLFDVRQADFLDELAECQE